MQDEVDVVLDSDGGEKLEILSNALADKATAMEDGFGSVDHNMVLTSQETLPVIVQDKVDVVLDSDGGEKLEILSNALADKATAMEDGFVSVDHMVLTTEVITTTNNGMKERDMIKSSSLKEVEQEYNSEVFNITEMMETSNAEDWIGDIKHVPPDDCTWHKTQKFTFRRTNYDGRSWHWTGDIKHVSHDEHYCTWHNSDGRAWHGTGDIKLYISRISHGRSLHIVKQT